VLVPADVVYCCLFQSTYGHEVHYPASSNGLGGGFDYLTATRQGLYELIERHYARHLERLDVEVEALVGDGPIRPLLETHGDDFLQTYDIRLFAIKAPALVQQLPFVFCMLGGAGRLSVGFGVSLDPLDAVRRAHTEAFQCLVTVVSGAREDLVHTVPLFHIDGASNAELATRYRRVWPRRRTLRFADWSRRFRPSRSTSVRHQIDCLRRFLATNGYPLVLVGDLSRAGVESKIVRAIVPGLLPCDKYQAHAPYPWTLAALEAARYRKEFR
jgi:YcaO-like protein with predicted kinase domain